MHYSPGVAVHCPFEQLVHKLLNHGWPKGRFQLVQILLHIFVIVLKYQHEPVAILSVHYLIKLDDVWILLQLLQHSDLPDGRAGDAVHSIVDLDLLNRHLSAILVFGQVDDAIGTLT